MITILLALALQSPMPLVLPAPPMVCTISEGHVGSDAIITRTRRLFTCATSAGGSVAVDRDWFKAHCRRVDSGSLSIYHEAAVCDAYADPSAQPVHLAQPSKFRDHLRAFGYGAVATALFALWVISGFPGFVQ